MTSQLEALRAQIGRRRARRGPPHVVAVTAGRGGAGVSLIAALLAIRGASVGRRTLLVDAEPWLDVQRVWLGASRTPTLTELGSGSVDQLVTPVHGSLELLSLTVGSSESRDVRAVVRRVPPLFSDRDLVVVDAGTRLHALERMIDLRVGSVVIVSASDAIGLASTHAMTKALMVHSEAPSRILFNRTGGADVEVAASVLREGAQRFLHCDLDILGALPEDPALTSGISRGSRLPELLVQSPLLDQVQPVLAQLLPPAAA